MKALSFLILFIIIIVISPLVKAQEKVDLQKDFFQQEISTLRLLSLFPENLGGWDYRTEVAIRGEGYQFVMKQIAFNIKNKGVNVEIYEYGPSDIQWLEYRKEADIPERKQKDSFLIAQKLSDFMMEGVFDELEYENDNTPANPEHLDELDEVESDDADLNWQRMSRADVAFKNTYLEAVDANGNLKPPLPQKPIFAIFAQGFKNEQRGRSHYLTIHFYLYRVPTEESEGYIT